MKRILSILMCSIAMCIAAIFIVNGIFLYGQKETASVKREVETVRETESDREGETVRETIREMETTKETETDSEAEPVVETETVRETVQETETVTFTRHTSEGEDLPEGITLYYTDTPEEEVEETPDGISWYADHEMIIQMPYGTTEEQAEEKAKAYDAELAGFLSLTGTCQWRFSEARDYEELENLAEELEVQGDIELAIPNYVLNIRGTEDGVPYESEYWNTKSSWDKTKLKAANWGYLKSGGLYVWQNKELLKNPIRTAILDVGFEQHEDLEYEYCVSGQNTDSTHGTHVMGIMAAKCGNGMGIAGIYPEGAGTGRTLAYDTNSTMGLNYEIADAVSRGAKVLNMSISTWSSEGRTFGCYKEIQEMGKNPGVALTGTYLPVHISNAKLCEYVLQALFDGGYDFLIVTTAGNTSSHTGNLFTESIFLKKENTYDKLSPVDDAGTIIQEGIVSHNKQAIYYDVVDPKASSYLLYIDKRELKEHIICVSSYNIKGEISGFANMSERVDILAPGENIVSTCSGGLKKKDGTSMAAPFVSGALACIWSMDNGLSSNTVREILLNSYTEQITDTCTGDTKPVLDIEKSMQNTQKVINAGEKRYTDALWWKEEETEAAEEISAKKPVVISIMSEDIEKNLSDYEIEVWDENGMQQEYASIEEQKIAENLPVINKNSESCSFFMLLPGIYRVKARADGYEEKEVAAEIEDKDGLQEIEIRLTSVSARVSAPIQYYEGNTYICGEDSSGCQIEDVQGNTVILEGAYSALVSRKGKILLGKSSDGLYGAIKYYAADNALEVNRIITEDADINSPFVLWNENIYYFDTEGDLWQTDIEGKNKVCVFRASDNSIATKMDEIRESDMWLGWKIYSCTLDGNLYFALNPSGGFIYRMNPDREITEICYDSVGGGSLLNSFAVDGQNVYVGAMDGIVRYCIDREGESEAIYPQFNSGFAMEGTEIYIAKGESVYRADSYLSEEDAIERLTQDPGTDVNRVVNVDNGRVYFCRNHYEGEQFAGWKYYSCSVDGTDESYHGYRPAESSIQQDTSAGAEQAFQNYIQNTLIPQYGVMSTEELYTQDVNSSEGTDAWSNQDLTGLLSASIKDYDQDGQKELLIIRCETVTEMPYYVEEAVTYSHMQMYEYDPETGAVYQTSERILQVCNKLINALGCGQICFFTYNYGGISYIAVDNFEYANERIVSLDLYHYDGTQFIFAKGLGYQEQGEGDLCVWEAATEPQGRCLTNCANWAEALDGDAECTWEEQMAFWVSDYDYQRQLTQEEMQQFYILYSAKLREMGLNAVDMRLGTNQEEAAADANSLDYASWYNQYAALTAADTYTAMEGEIEFLSGISTHQIMGGPLCLYRRDYSGSLDGYRNQVTIVSEIRGGVAMETDERDGQIIPDSDSRFLTDDDLMNFSLQQVCYAKNEIYARHGRKFLSDELTDYFNSQPWYTGSIEAADFTDEMANAVFNEYEKANVRFLADWEEKYGTYNPQ